MYCHMILLWCMTIFITSLLLFELSDLFTVVTTVEVPLDLRLLLHFVPLNPQLYLVIKVVLRLHDKTAILSFKYFSQFFQEMLFQVTRWLSLVKEFFMVLQYIVNGGSERRVFLKATFDKVTENWVPSMGSAKLWGFVLEDL